MVFIFIFIYLLIVLNSAQANVFKEFIIICFNVINKLKMMNSLVMYIFLCINSFIMLYLIKL